MFWNESNRAVYLLHFSAKHISLRDYKYQLCLSALIKYKTTRHQDILELKTIAKIHKYIN